MVSIEPIVRTPESGSFSCTTLSASVARARMRSAYSRSRRPDEVRFTPLLCLMKSETPSRFSICRILAVTLDCT